MVNILIAISIAYILYGANLEYLNHGVGKKFRLMTLLDWPWLIYTKEVTTA